MPVSNVYTYRMPSGIAGAVNREQEHTGEPGVIDATNVPVAFGDPVKLVAGKVQALAPGDTSAAVYGLLERPFPGAVGTYDTGGLGFGAGVPVAGGRCTVMKRGYMMVQLQGATAAAKNGVVYIRVAGTQPTGGHVGGLEAAVDGTAANTPVLPNAYWMGAADGNGNTELAFNL